MLFSPFSFYLPKNTQSLLRIWEKMQFVPRTSGKWFATTAITTTTNLMYLNHRNRWSDSALPNQQELLIKLNYQVAYNMNKIHCLTTTLNPNEWLIFCSSTSMQFGWRWKKKEQKYRIIVFLSKFSGDLVTL